MAFDEADIEAFIARLHDDPQLRDRVRNAILADDFLALPGIVARLGDRIEHLARSIDELVEAQRNTERRLDRLDGRVGNLEGWRFESTYVRNLGSRLGPYFRRARQVSIGDIDELYEALNSGRISRHDFEDLFQVDFVAQGQDLSSGRAEVFIAGELSVVVDEADVERAGRRAAVLSSAGLNAVAIVDGETILPSAAQLAEKLGVRHWLEPRAVA